MTADTESRVAPSLLHNWLSLAGIVLAASSFFAIACLFALDLFRGSGSPYMGILTYIVAPGFLIAGLLLVAAGAWWERRRRRTLRPGVTPALPRLDFNVPRQRHTFIAVAVVTAIFLLSTAVGSYQTYAFTESVTFCGKTCHSVMEPEYTAYQQSPHARVRCVQCHIGPGASWFVKSKLSGAYQVYATLANKYPRPIPTPIENLRPARETCEQCHWPKEFFGAAERTFHHYLPDEQNSPWTIQMLLKVGGGDPSFGAVGGIHWHMATGNRIEYIASDKQRQVIPWVRVTDEQGNVTVYQSSGSPLKGEQITAAQPRVMDCIDCHNRPAHAYQAPVASLDLALETGRIDRTIPRIKERAAQALTRRYTSTADAERGIADSLTTFYQSKYPAFAGANVTLIAGAVTETQRIYLQNFFPAMDVSWRVYPDNIGHLDFPGCYRCHDGSHTSADGKVITHDCDACHILIAQGPPVKLETSVPGLDFKHPVDIAGLWEQMSCSDCHAGSVVK
ncbi:MAG: NapC/NirT family cytochrome c [Gemmatimonadetes bacterium]|nr:NapC/NirT family cytochrome c [Gemmatimonadota bacterium]